MARTLYFNRTEAVVLAAALNNSKINCYSPSERAALPKLARRISNFLADGHSGFPEAEEPKSKKKLIGFAKTRAEDEDWQQLNAELQASVEPRPTVAADDRPALPIVPDCEQQEAIYARLKGTPRLSN